MEYATKNSRVQTKHKFVLGTRQIAEGVAIRRFDKMVLNTKAEWHQPALRKVRSELTRE